MVTTISPLVIGGVVFLLIGGGWMLFYWRVIDPLLRRILGRLLRADINRGEQQIWVVNQESEDSVSWRAAIIRPIQLMSMMAAGVFALLIGLVVTIWLSQ
ncbi:MAG: hypothetical protein GC179_16310 [Anaerolineaceae bacterium]|nr:hypothetical protein [Anaerolineaceae bacterium]